MKGIKHKKQCINLFHRFIVILLIIGAPAANADRATEVLVDALVKVTCIIPGKGKLVSTGFLWPDQGSIVTALHGVAGCGAKKLSVKSEKTFDTRFGKIDNVNQEGDLALIKLVDFDGSPDPFPADMTPLELSRDAPLPKVIGHYSISSYPNGGDRNDDHLAFRGSTPFIANLGTAFRPNKVIGELLASQSYPKHETQILRIGDTLRHGQSGAPIVDPSGKIIAIADGGLDGGFVGTNWAVLASEYLNKLKTHKEKAPGRMSKTAEAHLVSALLPEDKKVIRAPDGEVDLEHVRRLPLSYLHETLRRKQARGESVSGLEGLDFLKGLVSDSEYRNLAFDVYEDSITGATIGVPSQLDLEWDTDARLLITSDGATDLVIAVRQYDSYDSAVQYGQQEFADSVLPADWVDFESKDPLEFMALHRQDKFEWANNARFFNGVFEQEKLSMNLSVTISNDTLLSYAVIGRAGDAFNQSPDHEKVMYMMMQTAVLELAAFAAY